MTIAKVLDDLPIFMAFLILVLFIALPFAKFVADLVHNRNSRKRESLSLVVDYYDKYKENKSEYWIYAIDEALYHRYGKPINLKLFEFFLGFPNAAEALSNYVGSISHVKIVEGKFLLNIPVRYKKLYKWRVSTIELKHNLQYVAFAMVAYVMLFLTFSMPVFSPIFGYGLAFMFCSMCANAFTLVYSIWGGVF